MKSIVFFNNNSDVGKTSLVYHLAWAYADLGIKVLAADFDPQANLSGMFLEEERQEELWPEKEHTQTILTSLNPSTLEVTKPYNDKYCLSVLQHYRSLMSMALEAHKPMFHLKPADGAMGSHVWAVKDSGKEFEKVARSIAESCDINVK
ncbi:MAG: AAA family ATPase [Candidatus Magnetomorum sp.]|nr:AAA family ATPase [Candidatus Magnetomorum sp.]